MGARACSTHLSLCPASSLVKCGVDGDGGRVPDSHPYFSPSLFLFW
jgi:hypothetical protein